MNLNCNCALSVIKKPCPRGDFGCKRCATKMRNTGRVWKLVIPFYDQGHYLDPDTLVPRAQIGEEERIAEYDIFYDGAIHYLTCMWTNYGQNVFDQRITPDVSYSANGGDSYIPKSQLPYWLRTIVPDGFKTISASMRHWIFMGYSPARSGLGGIVEDDPYFYITLHHDIYCSYWDGIDGTEPAEIWHYATLPGLTYKCYEVAKCPLADGESMRFSRGLPTEPYDASADGPYDYTYLATYGFPPYIDGYHVDRIPYSDDPHGLVIGPSVET